MENLIFIMFLILLSAAVGLTFFYIKRLKKLFLTGLISKNMINQNLYSSLIVKDICNHILSCKKNKQDNILKALLENNFNRFRKELTNKAIVSKIDLCIKKNIIRFESKDIVYLLGLAKRYIQENRQNKALEILQQLKIKKLSLIQQAYYKQIMAQILLFEGDLLTASEDLYIALNIFKRKKMLFEEAETYFIIGTIYRISGVYDTAEIMFKSSWEIFAGIGSLRRQAEVLGTIGLLMSAQDRFEEARDYYQKALKKAAFDKTLRDFILSQQAMLELVSGKIKKADEIASGVLKNTKNSSVKANILDVLARIKFSEKKYQAAVKYASQAEELFYNNKNYSAYFECVYLKAIILVYAKKLDESENVLRKLIEEEKTQKSCFHIAGAYTLLGLILLDKNEHQRAKAIFNQALTKECCNNRKTGIAIDYANLAIVEKLQGNNKEAFENLQKALSQAKDTNENLIKKIKEIFN